MTSRFYDSLLCKVIATAPTFDKAVQRMARALQEFQVWCGTGSLLAGRTAAAVAVCRQRLMVGAGAE